MCNFEHRASGCLADGPKEWLDSTLESVYGVRGIQFGAVNYFYHVKASWNASMLVAFSCYHNITFSCRWFASCMASGQSRQDCNVEMMLRTTIECDKLSKA